MQTIQRRGDFCGPQLAASQRLGAACGPRDLAAHREDRAGGVVNDVVCMFLSKRVGALRWPVSSARSGFSERLRRRRCTRVRSTVKAAIPSSIPQRGVLQGSFEGIRAGRVPSSGPNRGEDTNEEQGAPHENATFRSGARARRGARHGNLKGNLFQCEKLAGAVGFEPTPSSLTVRCPTNWTTPQRELQAVHPSYPILREIRPLPRVPRSFESIASKIYTVRRPIEGA
jgi:hypothetical protein